jgi:hypothetical protein
MVGQGAYHSSSADMIAFISTCMLVAQRMQREGEGGGGGSGGDRAVESERSGAGTTSEHVASAVVAANTAAVVGGQLGLPASLVAAINASFALVRCSFSFSNKMFHSRMLLSFTRLLEALPCV